jgi:hypothetical protein
LLVNLTNLDANGRVRFRNWKTEWGFAHLLSHDTLNDSSNGYLVDDSCAFGEEVFITCKGECLSMISQPQSNYFTWKIDNFNNFKCLKQKFYFSEQFTVEGRKWYDWRTFRSSFIYIRLILLVYNLLLYILEYGYKKFVVEFFGADDLEFRIDTVYQSSQGRWESSKGSSRFLQNKRGRRGVPATPPPTIKLELVK